MGGTRGKKIGAVIEGVQARVSVWTGGEVFKQLLSLTQHPEEGGPESSLEGFLGRDPKSLSMSQHPEEGGPKSCLEGYFGEEPKSSVV